MDRSSLSAQLPIDRLLSLMTGEPLPARCSGAVLFADLVGFTPLTKELARLLGPRLGAEQLTRHLNEVYGVVIAEVHRFGGTVVDFSGDAVTCWFDDLRPSSASNGVHRALTCGLEMQRALQQLADLALPDGTAMRMSLKVAIAAGPAWRGAIGDPRRRLVDVLAGETVTRTAAAERVSRAGEVVLELGRSDGTPGLVGGGLPGGIPHGVVLGERRATVEGGMVAVVERVVAAAAVCPWPSVAHSPTSAGAIRPWIDHLLRERPEERSTELRATAALFVQFVGIEIEDPSCATALDDYVRWVQSVVDRHDGTLLQVTIGDKGSYLYIAFGAPVAHEDLADRAVACALDLRDAPVFGNLHQRSMGLDQGVARTGSYGGRERRTYGVLGDATNIAARLMTLGAPGEILVTERVRVACRRRYVIERAGQRLLKGQVEPVEISQVVDRPTIGTDGRVFGRLVGRASELDRLLVLLRAVLVGPGETIEVAGEAGIGKSHLIDAVRRSLADDGISWLTAASEERAGSSMHAFVPLLREAFFQDLAGSPEDRRRLFELGIDELVDALGASDDPAAARLAPLVAQASSALGALLGLRWPGSPYERQDPAGRLERSVRAVVTYLCAESCRRPVVLHLRDAHWLDEDSRRLVELIAEEAGRHRVCVLSDRRIETSAESRGAPGEPADERRIVLGALDRRGVAELAGMVLGGEVGDELVDRLVERTGGTPLFVEQLVLHLVDRALVDRGTDGRWGARQSAGDWDVSVSLSAVLVARLDRLADDVRQVVQAAAVLGDAFDPKVLIDLLGDDLERGRVEQAIEDGASAAVWSTSEGGAVCFRHALVRDAAYEMQLDVRRRELHRRAAGSVRRLGGRHGLRQSTTLALHDQRSGRPARAAAHLRRAGDAAAGDARYREAVALFERALDLIDEPESHRSAILAVHQRIAEAAGAAGDHERAVAHFRLAIERSTRPTAALVGRWTRLGEVLERLERDDEAVDAFERALDSLQSSPDLALASRIYTGLATVHGRRGELDAAVDLGDLALTFAGDDADAARAHQCLCVLEGRRDRLAVAIDHGRRSLRLWVTIGDPQGSAAAHNNLGLALAASGDSAAAIDELRAAVADFEIAGNEHGLACALDNLADLLVRHDAAPTKRWRASSGPSRYSPGSASARGGVIAAMWKAGSW